MQIVRSEERASALISAVQTAVGLSPAWRAPAPKRCLLSKSEPFGCLVSVMSNGAGKNASRQELPVVAEDTAFASINGVTEVGCLSSRPWRRLPTASTRVQIRQNANQLRPGLLKLVPQFVDHILTRQRAGTLDEAVAIPTASCGRRPSIRYSTVQIRDLGRSCNHSRSRHSPARKGATKFAPNRPTRSPSNYRFTKGYPCQAANQLKSAIHFPRATAQSAVVLEPLKVRNSGNLGMDKTGMGTPGPDRPYWQRHRRRWHPPRRRRRRRPNLPRNNRPRNNLPR
jgi:hypothetical protein